jgi:hypothetical protein
MTTSPTPAGDLRVKPAALGDAAGLAHLLAEAARSLSTGLAAGAAVGDPVCADALTNAGRLVEQTVQASAGGIDQLSQALDAARGTYWFADDGAVPRRSGRRP